MIANKLLLVESLLQFSNSDAVPDFELLDAANRPTPTFETWHIVLLIAGGVLAVIGVLGAALVQDAGPRRKMKVTVSVIVLILGAGMFMTGGIAAYPSPQKFEEWQSRQDAEVSRVMHHIESSLETGYVFESFRHPESDQDEWILQAFENDPFHAPKAEVLLEGGTVVEWGVVVDPVSMKARFVTNEERGTRTMPPEDFKR